VVAGTGEFELIAILVEAVEAARGAGPAAPGSGRVRLGSGDDAAITVPGGATATSVDALIEGVHFRRDTVGLSAVGRKALAVALSDLAAMGAAPGEAYVQLGVPDDLDEAAFRELASGLAETAAQHGVAVIGGDVTRAPSLIVAVTVVGHASSPDELVRRSGAGPGDTVAVTGELGGAAAGLLLLETPALGDGLPRGIVESLLRRHAEPQPRLDAGRALASVGATSMIDVSDGLGGDALHLATAGGVRLVVELERLPIQAGVAEVGSAASTDAEALATERGEDYELLVTLPPGRFDEARDALAADRLELTAIGVVHEGAGVSLRRPDGSERRAAGFDHFE
jgi:thiamine-monophosphate kinase